MPAKKSRKKQKSPINGVKRVALLLESDMAFDRAIARGVGEFIRSRSGWVILMDPMTEATLEGLKYWDPDGIITSIHLPAIDDIAKLSNVPKVGFGSYSEENDGHLTFPIVTSDQEEIGRMAARYFINKGMRHFAFCGGDEKALWCRQRREGFNQELKENGHVCENYEPDFPSPTHMPDALRSLGLWLERLPKPCGVFVFFDGWARWVLDACVIRQLQVPQQLSVLGVDNDRWLCELAQPRLSSIDANAMTAGYTAADLLDRLMKGDSACPPLTYIAPSKVEERDSSSYMAFADPEVAFAMRYIKEHACNPITPADVLKVTGMSNSTAYRKFIKSIGRSIHSEIQRIQMERVKELLTSTNLNVTSIAQQAGFENIRYLTQVFKDATGFTPTEYRRVHSTPDVGGAGSSRM
jgi:LacI family transcriptional regulator